MLAASDADGLPFIRNLPLQISWLEKWQKEALEPDLDSFQDFHPDGEGVIEFDAWMRKLDRIDGSYRN